MIITVENITNRLVKSYSHSLNESETERINKFLDLINDQKKVFSNLSEGLNKLSELLTEITWLDDIDASDEVLIKGIITMGKEADKRFKKYYSLNNNNYSPKGLFTQDLQGLKTAIEFHIETVLDLEHIIFHLRKDEQFNALDKLVNEI